MHENLGALMTTKSPPTRGADPAISGSFPLSLPLSFISTISFVSFILSFTQIGLPFFVS